MGYMGFGMRKEVYTRKPKKPFDKVKYLYEDTHSKGIRHHKYFERNEKTITRVREMIRAQESKLFTKKMIILALMFVLFLALSWLYFNYHTF